MFVYQTMPSKSKTSESIDQDTTGQEVPNDTANGADAKLLASVDERLTHIEQTLDSLRTHCLRSNNNLESDKADIDKVATERPVTSTASSPNKKCRDHENQFVISIVEGSNSDSSCSSCFGRPFQQSEFSSVLNQHSCDAGQGSLSMSLLDTVNTCLLIFVVIFWIRHIFSKIAWA